MIHSQLVFERVERSLKVHEGSLDFAFLDFVCIASLTVTLNTVCDSFNILLNLVVETREFKLDLIEHDESDDQYLRNHVPEKISKVGIVIYSQFHVT